MKCPKCNKEINSLKNIQSGSLDYDLSVNEDETLHYESGDFLTDDNVNDFCCPECLEVLFSNEEEAVKFLKKSKGVKE